MKERNTPNTRVRQGILEVMPINLELDVQQIKQLLAEHKGMIYGKDYSEGNLASALRVLSSKELLDKVDRGVYKMSVRVCEEGKGEFAEKSSNQDADSYGEILQIYRNGKKEIEDIINKLCGGLQNIDLSAATIEEIERLKPVIAFKISLTEMMAKFE